jgi:hypothetical protein
MAITPKQKRGRGRPREPDTFRVTPIFHSKPDMTKLGRAVIALAELLAVVEETGALTKIETKQFEEYK